MSMFCPECGSLLYPDGDEMVCRKCDYREQKTGDRRIVADREEQELTVIDSDEDLEVLPKTQVTCPKCGNNEAYWVLRQTRAADEPETRIYTCTECGHKWREY